MRTLFRAALPFVLPLSGAASAIEIEAGGRTIEIPVPAGYAELTPEMSPVYEAMYAYVVPTNERYLILVPDGAAEAFLRGEEYAFDRYMMIEAERQTVRFDITDAEFDEFRELMRGQLKEITESIRQNLPGLFDDASESMSQALDSELELSVGDVVPFEPHFDSDKAFAYSQLISMGVAVDGEELEPEVGMATSTFVNVRRKLIFVYVYGGEDDLEWGRVFSENWVNEILEANAAAAADDRPPSATSVGTPDEAEPAGDGSPFPLTMIIAMVIGALALIFVVRLIQRRGGS